MACNTSEEIKRVIREALCGAREPLESLELLKIVSERCGGEPNRVLFRKALASLVREGVVERISGEAYGKARVLFRCSGEDSS